jgi:hypothetical protein
MKFDTGGLLSKSLEKLLGKIGVKNTGQFTWRRKLSFRPSNSERLLG